MATPTTNQPQNDPKNKNQPGQGNQGQANPGQGTQDRGTGQRDTGASRGNYGTGGGQGGPTTGTNYQRDQNKGGSTATDASSKGTMNQDEDEAETLDDQSVEAAGQNPKQHTGGTGNKAR